MNQQKCYCGAQTAFDHCCAPIIVGLKKAETAEQLMRSRYSAYVTHHSAYLLNSTHASVRPSYSEPEILHWAISNIWLQLEIIKATETTVEFKAHYLDLNKKQQIHHEHSTFKKEEGIWYYVEGNYP